LSSKGQLTGMRGVYLVASELCRIGLIASPTSRSAISADILATDQECMNTYSVQVKTNASTFNFWLLNKKSKTLVSDNLIYVLVNIRNKKTGEEIEYFILPSRVIAEKMQSAIQGKKGSEWHSFDYKNALPFKDKWELFKT
jgi:hypothetical protein